MGKRTYGRFKGFAYLWRCMIIDLFFIYKIKSKGGKKIDGKTCY